MLGMRVFTLFPPPGAGGNYGLFWISGVFLVLVALGWFLGGSCCFFGCSRLLLGFFALFAFSLPSLCAFFALSLRLLCALFASLRFLYAFSALSLRSLCALFALSGHLQACAPQTRITTQMRRKNKKCFPAFLIAFNISIYFE